MGFPTTYLSVLGPLLVPSDAAESSVREKAWNELVNLYRPSVLAWFLGRGAQHATADDLTQELLIRMFHSLRTYNPDRGRFRPWLRTVLRNILNDFHRKAARDPIDLPACESGADFWAQLADADSADHLESAMSFVDPTLAVCVEQVRAAVEPATWKAFYDTVVEERPPREIAEELAMSVAAVYQARYRVTSMIRACRSNSTASPCSSQT